MSNYNASLAQSRLVSNLAKPALQLRQQLAELHHLAAECHRFGFVRDSTTEYFPRRPGPATFMGRSLPFTTILPDEVVQKLNRAAERLDEEIGHARAALRHREQQSLEELVKEELGICIGDVLSTAKGVRFRLQDLECATEYEVLRAPWVAISGPKLLSSGLPASSGRARIEFNTFEAALNLLGRGNASAPNPEDMLLVDMCTELDAFCNIEEDFARYPSDIQTAARALVTSQGRVKAQVARAGAEAANIRTACDWAVFLTLKNEQIDLEGKLWTAPTSEWPSATRLGTRSFFNVEIPGRLLSAPRDAIREDWRGLPRGPQLQRLEEHERRLHDLIAGCAVAAIKEGLAEIADTLRVSSSTGWPVLLPACGEICHARVAIAYAADPATTEPLEQLTGLTLESLLVAVPPYDWRFPSARSMSSWGASVRHAGGLSQGLLELAAMRHEVQDFYKQNDPDELRAQRKQEAVAALERERTRRLYEQQLPQRVYDAAASLDIGHKTGWSRQLAEVAGCHPTNLKRWLREHTPDLFGRLYPEGALLARPLI